MALGKGREYYVGWEEIGEEEGKREKKDDREENKLGKVELG